MNSWYRVTIVTPIKDAYILDNLTYLLDELGSTGTELKYALDYYPNEENLFGEIPQEIPQDLRDADTEIIAYYSQEINTNELKENILTVLNEENFTLLAEIIPNENWQKNWMTYYKPQRLSRYLSVVPVWQEDYQPDEGEQVIRLDPGIAFGTGSHPTTQLGAQALEIVIRQGDRVVDVGCGTGILSFIAGVLGASSVEGYDLDPQAVQSAQENLLIQDHAQIQSLVASDQIHFRVNDLLSDVQLQADVIVANILPHILVDMFEDAYQLLQPQGYLILGGILEHKGTFIEDAIAPYDFKQIQKIQMGEWLSYIYQKEVE